MGPPGGAVGYVVAVADTADFVAWWRRSWVLEFVARHGHASEREGEAPLFERGTHPELMLATAVLPAFPAHLHVDLLPEAQGRGLGRELLRTLGEELERQAVLGVHLGVGEGNTGAEAFYRRLGFDEPAPGLMTSPSSRLAGGEG